MKNFSGKSSKWHNSCHFSCLNGTLSSFSMILLGHSLIFPPAYDKLWFGGEVGVFGRCSRYSPHPTRVGMAHACPTHLECIDKGCGLLD